MSNAFVKGLKAAAAKTGIDQTQTKSGGDFERHVYPEGPVKLRFISYVELGKHVKEWQGQKKTPALVRLGFEVSGPKHAPQQTDTGPKPLVVYIEETLSLDPKANYVKLFSLINHDRTATHAVDKLGEAYIGRLVHKKFKRKDDGADPATWTGLDYKLRDDSGYTLRPPLREDPDTGDVTPVQVDPPISSLAAFLWDAPSKNQWDSIFIAGTYPERKNAAGVVVAQAKTKNLLQERIKAAENFKGSPIHAFLVEAGVPLDVAVTEDEGTDEAPAHAEAEPRKAAAQKVAPKVVKAKPAAQIEEDDIPW